ncbi:gamma-glutamyl-gamma-aminobutyrate hydrolase family protein [Thalassotalea ganghwensis]
MKLIGITPRVEINKAYHERRDALDQQWFNFLYQCGYLVMVLPNAPAMIGEYLKHVPIHGIILSGGNSLTCYGGDAPERDSTDAFLIEYAIEKHLPVLGVCRGMQSILHYFGSQHSSVTGHVTKTMTINIDGERRSVNSYHNLGCYDAAPPLVVDGKANDGVIKAIHHPDLAIHGIMWHPERNQPFEQQDIELIKKVFN